ncbi:hypothetical protein QUF70_12600 [Desulfobacterales bacterium HSG17]|nr:hypothetical protein [Desulfobacterales bacterium HSG17]
MESGVTKDWGVVAGGGKGYAICEGTAADMHRLVTKYSPYVHFDVQPVFSLDEAAKNLKTMGAG